MGDALNLDGLELTVVDTRGLLVGRQLDSQLSVSYAQHLPREPARFLVHQHQLWRTDCTDWTVYKIASQ